MYVNQCDNGYSSFGRTKESFECSNLCIINSEKKLISIRMYYVDK